MGQCLPTRVSRCKPSGERNGEMGLATACIDLNQYWSEAIFAMWEITLWPDVETWLLDLGDVDYVRGSRHRNLKELRPRSGKASAIRILFAFDPERSAILLVAGDKAGAWGQWYRERIPIADDRLDQWLEQGTGND
jgi:hypothetical protein